MDIAIVKSSERVAVQAKRKIVFSRKLMRTFQTIFAIAVTLVLLFPLYWMIVSSLMGEGEMLSENLRLWPSEGVHFKNFISAFTRVPMLKYMVNTVIVTFFQILFQVVIGVFAAYGFSFGHFRGKNALFLLVIGALMVLPQVTFIPIYIKMAHLGLIDTYTGLILPNIVSAYLIFMHRQNFKSVDQSYIDAGKLDGLGIVGTIVYILIPMCRASIVTVVLISFINGWNDYFWPRLLTKSDATRTIAVGLTFLKSSFSQDELTRNSNVIMTGVLLSIVPIIFFFTFCQKYMLKSYSKAAMK